MSDQNLLSPLRLGDIDLPNRVIMAPMTRSRAGKGDVATAATATYYVQRASAGLLITEGTQITQQGQGYAYTPGIHSADQVVGWKGVTEAVHEAGGRIAAQLWHVGRLSHRVLQPGGALPVAPSAIKPDGQAFTPQGMLDYEAPRALETDEIAGIVADFAKAAENAKAAGFDAVELHGANGYLIDQFIRSGSNTRTDRYGGSVENRNRFMLDVVAAVTDVLGGGRVGIRFSPNGAYHNMSDSNPAATFGYAAEQLNRFNLAFLHVIEPLVDDHNMSPPPGATRVAGLLRRTFKGPFILNGGITRAVGDRLIAQGAADAIAFGVPYIANPDLVERFRRNATLAQADRATFYGGNEKGYLDYPALDAA